MPLSRASIITMSPKNVQSLPVNPDEKIRSGIGRTTSMQLAYKWWTQTGLEPVKSSVQERRISIDATGP